MIYYIICAVIGYLIGSIPFGYIIVKLKKGIDIRTVGSGNIGATNVGRAVGVPWGILCFLLDVLKGFYATLIPTVIIYRILGEIWTSPPELSDNLFYFLVSLPFIIPGVFAIIGHFFPIYIGFRGGKGVATGLGVFLVLAPSPLLISLVIWIIFFSIMRYVSLASIVASFSLIVSSFFIDAYYFWHSEKSLHSSSLSIIVTCCIVGMLIILRHIPNIKRLIKGTEPKVNLWRTKEPEN